MLLTDLINTVYGIAGCDYLYLPKPVVVKHSPHSIPVNLWVITVAPDKKVYVMDQDGNWHPLEEKDEEIVSTFYQRVSLMSKQLKAIA